MSKPMLEMCADQFEMIAKMLRRTRSVRKIVDGKPGKSIPTWSAAAEEAEIAAQKIRAALHSPADREGRA